MRILYISLAFTPHDRRFLYALAKTQHEIYFLPLKSFPIVTGDIPQTVNAIFSETDYLSADHTACHLEKLKKVIAEIQPDVIQAGPIQTVTRWLVELSYHPLVAASWGYDLLMDADQNPTSLQLTKKILAGSTVLICDCETSQKKAIQLGFPEERIVTFPWGIDLHHFISRKEKKIRDKLQWQNNFIMLSTRMFEKIYGVDIIARAFIQIVEQYPDVRLLLLGQGSEKPYLEKILLDGNVQDKVHFAGKMELNYLPDYYCAGDLYLSASHVDGTSISLLEAMACGLPVMVSDIPSNQEWVQREAGWLFQDNSVEDLVKKMQMALKAKTQLELMGQRARKIVEARADWNKNYLNILKAYEKAIDLIQVGESILK